MKPIPRHPECGTSCLGPHPDYCQSMSDCWLKGQRIGPKPPRKPSAKDRRIAELEAEVAQLKGSTRLARPL